ncbi:MAG TPA: hypothetical protein VMT34_00320 [Aggregatilineales bacterium]|nr:hypothetical protein [Aggregatilineales bacterium]
MRISRTFVLATMLVIVGVIVVCGEQPALAQGPQRGGRPSIDAQAFNACTTTDYASIAAKALNISTADLRKAIVAGQTVQDIAASANVNYQTVADAVQAARQADVDQAVKDGVMTQDEAAVFAPLTGGAPAGAANAPAQNPVRTPGANGGNGPRGGAAFAAFPDISTIRILLLQLNNATPDARGGGGFGGGFGAINPGLFNRVKQYGVAAQALNMKCTDLVKILITPPGKSIVAVAVDQKVDSQTVSDALTKAYKDALAQDVTDGIIAQADSDKLATLLDKLVSTFVNNPLPMGPQATPAR